MIYVTLGKPSTGETIELQPIGRKSGVDRCSDLILDDEEFIQMIEISYSRDKVESMGVLTTKG